jgi:hypothetical protein
MVVGAKNWELGDSDWTKLLLPVFGISLGSHLIIDFFQGGNLVGIPKQYEFLFYMANGMIACAVSCFQMRDRLQKQVA